MKYKVGDKVRVRQWDDMAKEFGESFGSIDIPHFYFPRSMEKYCGEVVTIEKADTCSYHIKEDEEHWYWTDDMFEPYKVTLARQADFIDKEAYSKLIKQLEKQRTQSKCRGLGAEIAVGEIFIKPDIRMD